MNARDIQTALLGLLGTLKLFANFTPSKKDDALVNLLFAVTLNPDLFGELLVLLGKANNQPTDRLPVSL